MDVAGLRGPLVLQGVHHVLHPPVELASWPEAEGEGQRSSRLVLIAQAEIAPALRDSWTASLPGLVAAQTC